MNDGTIRVIAVCTLVGVSIIMALAYKAGIDTRANALECAKLKGYWTGEVCRAVKP